MTEFLYFETDKTTCTAKILSVDLESRGIVLDRSIFHPKGGGQPDDVGKMNQIPIMKAYIEDDMIVHVVHDATPFEVGDEVTIEIDEESRHYHSRLHTAGHVLAEMMERLYPLKAVKGNHFPDQASVEFQILEDSFSAADCVIADIEQKLRQFIEQNNSVVIHNEQPRRVLIEGLDAATCGGTHVKGLAEIGEIKIRNIKKKKSAIRVGYLVLPELGKPLGSK